MCNEIKISFVGSRNLIYPLSSYKSRPEPSTINFLLGWIAKLSLSSWLNIASDTNCFFFFNQSRNGPCETKFKEEYTFLQFYRENFIHYLARSREHKQRIWTNMHIDYVCLCPLGKAISFVKGKFWIKFEHWNEPICCLQRQAK